MSGQRGDAGAPLESESAELDALRDEAAIRRVLSELCHAVDRGDAVLVGSQFQPNATIDEPVEFTGTAVEFAKWVAASRDRWRVLVHHQTNVLVEVHGDVAAAQSYVIVIRVEDQTERFSWKSGRYLDRFERRDGTWKIAARQYVHDVDLPVPIDPLDLPAIGTYVEGVRSPSDPSYALFGSIAAGEPWPSVEVSSNRSPG